MHPLIQPYTTYKTKDGKYCVIGCATDGQFEKLSKILGLDLHLNALYLTNRDRVKNKDKL